jgi:biuret amidohydrolase
MVIRKTTYDAFVQQLRVVFIDDAIGACTDAQHMSSMLSMANWLYESRVTSAKGLDLWLNGEPFGGWIWSRGYEFPYTLESLKRDYEHLIAPAVQAAAASAL